MSLVCKRLFYGIKRNKIDILRFVQTGLMMLYEVTKELTEKLDALDLDEKSSSIRSQVVLQLNGLKKMAEANLKETAA